MRQFFTVIDLFKTYKKENLPGDLSAGFSTGVLLIPQGMAYAIIAGLPVEYGLYASLIAPLFYLMFGNSTKLVLGPGALESILLASSMGALGLVRGSENYITTVLSIVVLAGVFQLLAGVLKLGFVSYFFSSPMLKGFVTGAAFLIGLSQLGHILGFQFNGHQWFHLAVVDIVQGINKLNVFTLTLGLLSVLALVLMKKTKFKTFSTPLIVVATIALSYGFDFKELGIPLVENIPSGIPGLHHLTLSEIHWAKSIPVAIGIGVLGFTISMSINKSVEEHPSSISANGELKALGMANLLGPFLGSYQASSSFSRTAINKASGAKSRVSNLFSSVLITLVLLLFTQVFYYLPMTILGAVIIAAMPSLMSFDYLKTYFKTDKRAFWVMLLTFVSTVEFGILPGMGVGFSLTIVNFLLLYPSHYWVFIFKMRNSQIEKYWKQSESDYQVDVFFDGPVFFGNINQIANRLKALHHQYPDAIISIQSNLVYDNTALDQLTQLNEHHPEICFK